MNPTHLPELRVPGLSRFTVAMIALLVSTFAVSGGHADLLPFMRRADGVLHEVRPVQETRKTSRGRLQLAARLDLRYSFEVDGQRWQGRMPYPRRDGWAESLYDSGLRNLGPGDRVAVWYDLRDPSTAWLRWPLDSLATAVGGVLLALGLWIAVLTPSLWRDDRSRPRFPSRDPFDD